MDPAWCPIILLYRTLNGPHPMITLAAWGLWMTTRSMLRAGS